MRFKIKTALAAAVVAAISCLLPGIVSGKLIWAMSVGASISACVAYISYSYEDPIYEAPIDLGSIVFGNLVGPFASSIVVATSYWQAFWLAGATLVFANILMACYVFIGCRAFSDTNEAAFELFETMFQTMLKRPGDRRDI